MVDNILKNIYPHIFPFIGPVEEGLGLILRFKYKKGIIKSILPVISFFPKLLALRDPSFLLRKKKEFSLYFIASFLFIFITRYLEDEFLDLEYIKLLVDKDSPGEGKSNNEKEEKTNKLLYLGYLIYTLVYLLFYLSELSLETHLEYTGNEVGICSFQFAEFIVGSVFFINGPSGGEATPSQGKGITPLIEPIDMNQEENKLYFSTICCICTVFLLAFKLSKKRGLVIGNKTFILRDSHIYFLLFLSGVASSILLVNKQKNSINHSSCSERRKSSHVNPPISTTPSEKGTDSLIPQIILCVLLFVNTCLDSVKDRYLVFDTFEDSKKGWINDLKYQFIVSYLISLCVLYSSITRDRPLNFYEVAVQLSLFILFISFNYLYYNPIISMTNLSLKKINENDKPVFFAKYSDNFKVILSHETVSTIKTSDFFIESLINIKIESSLRNKQRDMKQSNEEIIMSRLIQKCLKPYFETEQKELTKYYFNFLYEGPLNKLFPVAMEYIVNEVLKKKESFFCHEILLKQNILEGTSFEIDPSVLEENNCFYLSVKTINGQEKVLIQKSRGNIKWGLFSSFLKDFDSSITTLRRLEKNEIEI